MPTMINIIDVACTKLLSSGVNIFFLYSVKFFRKLVLVQDIVLILIVMILQNTLIHDYTVDWVRDDTVNNADIINF